MINRHILVKASGLSFRSVSMFLCVPLCVPHSNHCSITLSSISHHMPELLHNQCGSYCCDKTRGGTLTTFVFEKLFGMNVSLGFFFTINSADLSLDLSEKTYLQLVLLPSILKARQTHVRKTLLLFKRGKGGRLHRQK